MRVVHVELADANKFVAEFHRHHKPVRGHRFSIGAIKDGNLVGVAIVGRPVARNTDYRRVLEVTRLCTNGTKNAPSFLYSAAARCAKELGYDKIQTFILDSEPGTSLLAAGWIREGKSKNAGNKGWGNRKGRRTDQPTKPKILYSRSIR